MKPALPAAIQGREDTVRLHLALNQNHDVDLIGICQVGDSFGQRLAINIPKQKPSARHGMSRSNPNRITQI